MSKAGILKLSIRFSGQLRVSRWVLGAHPSFLYPPYSCLRGPDSLQTRKRRRHHVEVSASQMQTGNCFHSPASGREVLRIDPPRRVWDW